MRAVPFIDRKEAVTERLIRAAFEDRPITYTELGLSSGIPTRGPWRPLLDLIADEMGPDRDITSYVLKARTGTTGRVNRRDASAPNEKQRSENNDQRLKAHEWVREQRVDRH